MLTQEEIDALPDELALTLRKPIALNDNMTFAEITFHEPTLGQIKAASLTPGGEIAQMVALLAASGGVPPAVIERLSAREMTKARTFIESFTQDARPTGEDA